jgi:hypothetical protein
MAPLQHPDLARLSRVISALRQGETITLPFVPNARGTFSEEFRLGRFHASSDEDDLLHRVTHRMKSGRETTSRWEPLDWSLDDLMGITADWPAEILDRLPSFESIGNAPSYDILRRLDAGETVVFSGTTLSVAPHTPSDANACTIRIAFPSETAAAYTAADLIRYKPR